MSVANRVTITCDGACLGNGQALTRAAAAAILDYNGRKRAVGIYIGESTNQRAEILAAAIGLETLTRPCIVTLQTDSRYVVDTMVGIYRRRTNLEYWENLDAAASPHEVTYQWVKGHNGHPEQETADRLARSFAQLGEVPELILAEAVNRLYDITTPALRDAICEGLRYLASDCDGAQSHDGVGFSKFDSELGHSLATKTLHSPKEIAIGRRLLHRYSSQLQRHDPRLAAII